MGDEYDPTKMHRQSVDSGGGWGMCKSAISKGAIPMYKPGGRWPANLIHDGSQEQDALLGSASRYFYCAKASKADRGDDNGHPTVKPTDLMRYLCRLVTPPDGIVLDPFAGSGSTGKAAMLEGFRFIGIERDEQYCEIAAKRIQRAEAEADCQSVLWSRRIA